MRLRLLFGTGTALIVLSLAAPAGARSSAPKETDHSSERGKQQSFGRGGHDRSRPQPRTAPEFDPAAAGVIAALLAGGTALLARRRRE